MSTLGWSQRQPGTSASRKWRKPGISWRYEVTTSRSIFWTGAGRFSGTASTRQPGRYSPTRGQDTWRTWRLRGPPWSHCGFRSDSRLNLIFWVYNTKTRKPNPVRQMWWTHKQEICNISSEVWWSSPVVPGNILSIRDCSCLYVVLNELVFLRGRWFQVVRTSVSSWDTISQKRLRGISWILAQTFTSQGWTDCNSVVKGHPDLTNQFLAISQEIMC